MDYKSAGVDIDKGLAFVDIIKEKSFWKPSYVLEGIGGFASLTSITNYKDPVLVSSTDGVGTKLLIAQTVNIHNTVGIDLVAMGINDVIVYGARPLFFLDYIACGRLDLGVMEKVIEGIVTGCNEAECPLVGGETAEMPDFYPEDRYDLAGFAVGIVERDKIIDGRSIREDDIIIGLPSSGLHSNGFSLIRRVIKEKNLSLEGIYSPLEKPLYEELLVPTKIYWKQIKKLLENGIDVKGMAHITGGGIIDNIPRVFPEGLCASINTGAFPRLPIFTFISEKLKLPREELYRTFNMGIGMVIIVNKKESEKVCSILNEAIIIGKVISGKRGVIIE
ncbi:MAG: phosphoribosylformylglycinamidine cyclo-ligase [bacterium]|nr:phosphoribosylformylglycinamidine cyclo-ligase [bacterium]